MEKILVINPGSTSTKVACFEDEEKVWSETIQHPDDVLASFQSIIDQAPYRHRIISELLASNGTDESSLTCIMARGGLLPPVESGAYVIDETLVEQMRSPSSGTHASNLASIIAYDMAQQLHIPAYIYDPISVDETAPFARLTGIPEIRRAFRGHPLNTRAVANHCAETVFHKPLSELTFIVAHMGGGSSIRLLSHGRAIDALRDDEGFLSPERSGRIPALALIDLCYSGKYTHKEMVQKQRGGAGWKAYLGTSDARTVVEMAQNGDETASQMLELYCYTMAKSIGELAVPVRGKVDRIILTGGVAHAKVITDRIAGYVDWIAPVDVIAGEFEMEALAYGGLRVLRKQVPARYWTPPGKQQDGRHDRN